MSDYFINLIGNDRNGLFLIYNCYGYLIPNKFFEEEYFEKNI